MISLIKTDSELDRDLLLKTLSGRKMLAYMKAYGAGYDFCRFYKVEGEYGSVGTAYMFIINSTLIICGDGRLEATEELQMFVDMNQPFRIEGDQKILSGLNIGTRYQRLNRTVFELVPDENSYKFAEEFVDFDPALPDVYTILSEGFRVLTYRGSTTASVVFDIGNVALIGQVATKVSARGSGYAREFLKWLALFLNNNGKRAYLLALDIRVSFYREIGFREVEHEIVLERIDVEKESASKGRMA